MEDEISLDLFTANIAFLIGEDNETAKVESFDDIGDITVTFPSGRKFCIEIIEEEPDDEIDDEDD
jgi:hypothetical protein